MKITPEQKRISELFNISSTDRYVVPNFQRSYSWGTGQIEQLFNDIIEEDLGYYVGNILVTKSKDEENCYSIIDGQQRLTTISLFLLGIGEKLADEYPLLDRKIARIQDDIERELLIDSGGARPRIELLKRDHAIYSDLLGKLVGGTPKAWSNRVLSNRYRYARSLIDSLQTPADIQDFYAKVQNLELLRVDVPDIGDAFSVFSSLNSKGVPLTLIDLLKGEFLEASAKSGDSQKTVNQWNELARILSGTDSDIDNRRVTQFLLNNYDAFEGEGTSSTTKTKALSQYQQLLRKRYRAGEDYLQTLISRAHVFARIVQIEEAVSVERTVGDQLAALDKLESTQALPLLMYLFCNEDDLAVSKELPEILDSLIAFYVRRNIVLTPKSSNIRAKVLGIVRTIQQNQLTGSTITDVVIQTLADIIPTDEQFIAALDQPIYDKNKKTARFVLIDIERRVGNCPAFDKGHPDNLDQYRMTSTGRARNPYWSIEHILPEGPLPPYWMTELSDQGGEDATEKQAAVVHKFGNLTLTPYNAELAQKPFYCTNEPEKNSKRDYQDERTGGYVGLRSNLFLNSSIPDTEAGETIQTKEHWTLQDIERRNQWFIDIMLKLYAIERDD